MKRVQLATLAVVAVVLCAVAAASQPPDGRGKGPGKKGPPPPFVAGKVLPPFIRDGLDLTEEQEKQLVELETEVRRRLLKILTAEQRDKLEELGKRPPPRKGGFDGPPDEDGPPGKKGPRGKKGPPDGDEVSSGPVGAGIQWYATWQSGLRAAQHSGRPILLVSAAPHCAGVPGTW